MSTLPPIKVKVVALIELADGTIELHASNGKSLGRFTRCGRARAQWLRGARRSLAGELSVAAFILRRCKAGGRGQAVLTDAQIAKATKLSPATVFRCKNSLCKAGLFTWQILGRHRGSRYTLKR
jgi:hypothetical protein